MAFQHSVLLGRIQEYSHIRSIIIQHDEKIVFRENSQGLNNDSYHHIASITKSITGTIIGNALANGYISDLDRKICFFFPEVTEYNRNKHLNDLTVKNILTMTTGMSWAEKSSDLWDKSADILKVIFDRDMDSVPGGVFNYNTAAVHLLSLLIRRCTKMSLVDYANRFIFDEMEIQSGEWSKDAEGNPFGGHSAHFKIEDLLKIGMLYQKKGLWENKQLLPANYVEDATFIQNSGGVPENCKYGYLLWINSIIGFKTYFASGFGGQYIYNVDDLNLIIVITSSRDKPHFENRKLIENVIVPQFI
jgi:CubicO group peptidase (beta-lactamase class C family)